MPCLRRQSWRSTAICRTKDTFHQQWMIYSHAIISGIVKDCFQLVFLPFLGLYQGSQFLSEVVVSLTVWSKYFVDQCCVASHTGRHEESAETAQTFDPFTGLPTDHRRAGMRMWHTQMKPGEGIVTILNSSSLQNEVHMDGETARSCSEQFTDLVIKTTGNLECIWF